MVIPELIRLLGQHGILMDVLCGMLKEEGLDETIRVTSLFAPEPEKCMALLQGL